MHLIQASLLLYSQLTGGATCMTALLFTIARVAQAMGLGDHHTKELAILMIVTAALALIGVFLRLGWIRLMIFLPQHTLLGIMMIGGLWAAAQGAYLDNTVKPWEHILADQLGIAALFAIHTSAIIRRARDPNG